MRSFSPSSRRRSARGFIFDLRRQLFGGLVQQSIGFFTSSRTGDLLSWMNNDVGGIEDVISDTVFGFVASLVVAVSTLAVMLSLSWHLTLAALAIMPIVPAGTWAGPTYDHLRSTDPQPIEKEA